MTTEAQALDNSRAAVRSNIELNSEFDLAHVAMNGFATIVACYGLFENSPVVVIGAMVIAMLLGPISGVALGLVDKNNNLPFGRWQEAAQLFTGRRSCSV